MSLDESVTSLKGVGDSLANKLHKLGVYTIGDLINYYPRKYDDYSDIKNLSSKEEQQKQLYKRINIPF